MMNNVESNLLAVAILISNFRKNVFDKLVLDVEPFGDKDRKDSLSYIGKIKEAVNKVIEKEKNHDKNSHLQEIAKQIFVDCDEILKQIPQHTSADTPNNETTQNRIEGAGNKVMDSAPDQIYKKELEELYNQIVREQEAISDCRRKQSVAEGYDEEERHRISLEKHEKYYEMYLEKYRKLRSRIDKDRDKISSSYEINELVAKIDSLGVDFTDAIKDTLEIILQRFDNSDKKIISDLRDSIEDSQTAIIDTVLAAIDDDKFSKQEMNMIATLISQDLAKINPEKAKKPSLAKKLLSLSQQTPDEKTELEVKHYIKLSIPVILGLINYEIILGLKGTKSLKKVWDILIDRFGSKKPMKGS